MKRISVPIENMTETLMTLNISRDHAEDIVRLFEVVDMGRSDELALPVMPFNDCGRHNLTRKDMLITLFSFWRCVSCKEESDSELLQQALGAIRALFFVAENFGYQNLSTRIEEWWHSTVEPRGSESVTLEQWL